MMTDKFETDDRTVDDDARLERLVDGELSPDEYRKLVASLDEQPDAWRRCALAFLESQALGGELRGIHRAMDSRDQGAVPATRTPAGRGRESSMWSLLAIAASFLVMFGLGVAAPQIVAKWRQEFSAAGNPHSGQAQIATTGIPAAPHRAMRPIGNVTLVMDGPSGDTTAGQVPVYEVHEDLNQYLSADRPALGPELVDWLRQQGFDVRHQPQYVPAPLDDGRQIIVPIDGYQITPVGTRY
jgi:anti-sigma factor RsiW